MERMRIELEDFGRSVQFVTVNKDDAAPWQEDLASRCSFPLVQDLPEVGAWDLMDGNKDDIYIYDREGNLAVYLPFHGAIETNLSTEEGYRNLLAAILSIDL